jgi:hypothetical protein
MLVEWKITPTMIGDVDIDGMRPDIVPNRMGLTAAVDTSRLCIIPDIDLTAWG